MITITCDCGAVLPVHNIAQPDVAIKDENEFEFEFEYSYKLFWSKKEDRQLQQAVKKNPENLTKCFSEVARKQNRKARDVSNRWYHVLRHGKPLFYLDDNSLNFPNMKNKKRSK